MDRGAWQATVQGVTKSQTWLRNWAHTSIFTYTFVWGFPDGLVVKKSTSWCRRCRLDPWVRKTPWRRKWLHTPVLFPGKSHRQRSLVGYSVRGLKESDGTETAQHTHLIIIFHFSLATCFNIPILISFFTPFLFPVLFFYTGSMFE